MLQHRPIHSGVLSAFAGSVAMGVLLAIISASQLAPGTGTVRALNAAIGTESAPAAGWFVFFVIFTLLWGVLYGLLAPKLPGRSASVRGLVFGAVAWLITMLVVMPAAGFGLFGQQASAASPVISLVLHLIYGSVLGAFHGWLTGRHPARTSDAWPGGSGY